MKQIGKKIFLLWLLNALLASSLRAQAPLQVAKTFAELTPAERDDRILEREPTVELKSDGVAVFSFQTRVPTPAAIVHLGIALPDELLDYPRYRLIGRENLSAPATEHSINVSIKTFDPAPAKQIADPAERDDGVIFYRFEIYDPRSAGPKYFQGRFRFLNDEGKYRRGVTITYGPVVDQVTANSALISWETDQPTSGEVKIVHGGQMRSFQSTIDRSTRHEVRLTDLAAASQIEYLVESETASGDRVASRRYFFRTINPKAKKFSFAFLSDSRSGIGGGENSLLGINYSVLTRLIASMFHQNVDFVLFGGDLSSGYTSSAENYEWMLRTWMQAVEPLAHYIPVYEGVGNHESLIEYFRDSQGNGYNRDKRGEVNSLSIFRKLFANPVSDFPQPETRENAMGPSYEESVYSFDFLNAHFVMINTDYWLTQGTARDHSENDHLVSKAALSLLGGNREGYLMPNQLAWLKKDLAAARARGIEHIFIAGHEMAFPNGGHADDAMWWNGLNDASLPLGDATAMRDRFLGLVSEYRVTAMLFGHEHNYSRLTVNAKVHPLFKRPVTQIISGAAGAPFYRQDMTLPWAASVNAFSLAPSYVVIQVNGKKVSLKTLDGAGQVIDSAALAPQK